VYIENNADRPPHFDTGAMPEEIAAWWEKYQAEVAEQLAREREDHRLKKLHIEIVHKLTDDEFDTIGEYLDAMFGCVPRYRVSRDKTAGTVELFDRILHVPVYTCDVDGALETIKLTDLCDKLNAPVAGVIHVVKPK
jgi:hypothetical protein